MTHAPQAVCGACAQRPPALDRTITALDYAFPWDGLLQAFKFRQAIQLGPALLEPLHHALDTVTPPAPDWLLPVPLSAQRLKARGYNQSLLLARALAKRRGLRCDAKLLLRVREHPQQAGLKLSERTANVRGVFAVEPTRLAELRGQRVALIDDVMTSGATLFEAARTLRQAGAIEVHAWVLARTPEPS